MRVNSLWLIWECKFGVLSVSISTCKLVVPRVQIMSHLPKPARRLSALVEKEYLKQTGLGSSYFGSIYLWFVSFWVKIVWVKFWFDCNFLGQITLGQISVGSNFLFLGQISIWSNFLGWIFLGSNYLGPNAWDRFSLHLKCVLFKPRGGVRRTQKIAERFTIMRFPKNVCFITSQATSYYEGGPLT